MRQRGGQKERDKEAGRGRKVWKTKNQKKNKKIAKMREGERENK